MTYKNAHGMPSASAKAISVRQTATELIPRRRQRQVLRMHKMHYSTVHYNREKIAQRLQ